MKNKNLEKKILRKVYKIEARKTFSYLLTRLLLGLVFLLAVILFYSTVVDILNEQQSFDLLFFYRQNFAVVKRYFLPNLFNFYQELPEPLTYLLIISIIIVLVVTAVLIKNFKKIKNKLVALYKFYKTK
ncbi:hypothetical protein M1328_04515 [Patescibacteria group bacterium]|nr:hypothetical protein [Patescibacteria group bacterium]